MDLVEIGIDVAGFNTQKQELLQSYIDLFNQLQKYDGSKVSPVNITGLSQLNETIKNTNSLLTQLTQSLGNLSTAQNAVASSTKTVTQSNTELGLAVKAYAAEADNAAKISAKLAAADSEQAKQTAALKVELSEAQKQLKANAEAMNQTVQARKEEIQSQKDQAKAAQDSSVAQKQSERDKAAIIKQQEREIADVMRATAKATADAERLSTEARNKAAKDAKIAAKAERDAIADAARAQELEVKRALEQEAIDRAQARKIEAKQRQLANNAAVQENTSAIEKAGSALTKGLSFLRNIAYILPGVGLAGLFDLIFQGIGKVASALGIFSNKQREASEASAKLTESLIEQEKILDELNNRYKENSIINFSIKAAQIDVQNERGRSPLDAMKEENRFLIEQFNFAKSKIVASGEDLNKITDEQTNKAIERFKNRNGLILDNATKFSRELVFLKDQLATDRDKRQPISSSNANTRSDTDIQADIDMYTAKLKLTNDEYDKNLGVINNFYELKSKLEKSDMAIDKANHDERRLRLLDEAKNLYEITVSNNQQILDSKMATQEDILKAIEGNYKAQKKLIVAEENNILSDRTASEQTKASAVRDTNQKLYVLQNKYLTDVNKLNNSYQERDLVALNENTKNKIEVEAAAQQTIFQNDRLSLEERLNAYKIFVADKKKQIESDYNTQKELAERNGATQEELAVVETNRTKRIAELTAQVSKDVYSITSTYGQKLINQVKEDVKNLGSNEASNGFTENLDNLNKEFNDRLISYRSYLKRRKTLENQYSIDAADEKLRNSQFEINDTKNKLDVLLGQIEESNVEISAANQVGNQEQIDAAKAKNDGLKQSYTTLYGTLTTLQQDYNKNSLALSEAQGNKLKEGEKERARLEEQILQESFNLAKTIIDAQFEYKLEKLEKQNDLVQEAYDNEIAAIERATLTERNRTALQIQTEAQKAASAKRAAQEEKKIKHDQAVADRAVSIASIETEAAVAAIGALQSYKGLPIGFVIAAAIETLAQIKVAQILATPIPSFAEGGVMEEAGFARYGEAGRENIKLPSGNSFFAEKETISWLPRGTVITPMYDVKSIPDLTSEKEDKMMTGFMYLGKQINKNNKQIKQKINNTININLGFEQYKAKKIYGIN